MKIKKITLHAVSTLFGLLMINGGLNKFFSYMPMPEEVPEAVASQFSAMMQLPWLMPLVGIAELVGGVLFILPKTRALGAIVVFPVMLGIIGFHISTEPGDLVLPLILFVINLVVIVENRKKYLPMISK